MTNNHSRPIKGIVLTGFSSDLGARLAHGLAEAMSVPLILTTRRKKRRSDRIPRGGVLLDECDLLDIDQCRRVADLTRVTFKGPVGVVHSVGDFWDHVPFRRLPAQRANELMSSHVNTFSNLMYSILPVLEAKGGGSVVSFSCNSVRYNYPWMAPFTAAKSAVDSMTRSLANEYAGSRIRLNSLVLASLQTDKVARSKPHGDFAHFIPPDDLVPIVTFLFSPASYLISGNGINLFTFSPTFYKRGYFQRIAR